MITFSFMGMFFLFLIAVILIASGIHKMYMNDYSYNYYPNTGYQNNGYTAQQGGYYQTSAQVQQNSSVHSWICDKCGDSNSDTTRYCSTCGNSKK